MRNNFLLLIFLLNAQFLMAQIPANDDLCNALLIQLSDSCTISPNGDNTGATAQAGEPKADCLIGTPNSVWFKFVAPPSGLVRINTQNAFTGTLDDTQIALYELAGNDCNQLADLKEIACNQDVSPPVLLNSEIPSVSLTSGETYYISVSGWNDGEGTFCINVDEIFSPSNDLLCDAVPIVVGGSCNGNPNGDNTGATAETGEPKPDCFVEGPNSVWYTFLGPASGYVTISTDIDVGGTNPDTEIALYTAANPNCPDMSELIPITCNQDGGTNLRFASKIRLAPAPTGEKMFIQVSGWNDSEGSFCLEVLEAPDPGPGPPNNQLCNAKTLNLNEPCFGAVENVFNALFEVGEPYPDCFDGELNSVWYQFTVPPSGLLEIRTDKPVGGSEFDTQMALYRLPGGNCNDLTKLELITCDQDGGKQLTNNAAIFTDELSPGEMIFVQVASQDTGGTFCIELNEITRPVNDIACNAIDVEVDGQVRDFNNFLGTTQAGEGTIAPNIVGDCNASNGWCVNNGMGRTVWFSFEAPSTGALNIDLCNGGVGTDFDTRIAVYEVDNCNNFASYQIVGANDDLFDCDFASQLELNCLQPGQTYYLMVTGFPFQQGIFGLSMTALNPAPLAISANTILPYCPDGNSGVIGLTTSGGTPPYAYAWSNGDTTSEINELLAGDYMVEVSDACGVADSLSVTIPDSSSTFTASVIDDQQICAGDSVQLNANPNGGLPHFPENAFGQILNEKGLFRLNTSSPETPVEVAEIEGKYFASDFGPGGMYVIEVDENLLQRMDTVTGRLTNIGKPIPAFNHIWSGLAWDEQGEQMYGISVNQGGAGSKLYKIDHTNGQLSDTLDMRIPFPIWLAINDRGDFYTMDIDTDSLYEINSATGALRGIGPIGFDANFAQDADFDPVTGDLVMATMNNNDQFQAINELRIVNLNDGSTRFIGEINTGLGQMTTFAISRHNFTGDYEYQWTPGIGLNANDIQDPWASPPTSTDYEVSITDACGTVIQQTVSVQVSNIMIDFDQMPDSTGGIGNLLASASGGVSPYSYQWAGGETTDQLTGIPSGIYTVTVTDSLGCAATDSIDFIISSTVRELAGIQDLRIFPNPTQASLNLVIRLKKPTQLDFAMLDLRGRELWNSSPSKSNFVQETISLADFPKGMYILQIQTEAGRISQRIWVQ